MIIPELLRSGIPDSIFSWYKYGRYLAYIYYHKKFTNFIDIIREGKTINTELVKRGLAKEI